METPKQEIKEQLITLELSVRDAQVVKAILEQQLLNSGMATYMNVANQLQKQLPDQPQPGQIIDITKEKVADEKKK